MLTIKQTLRQLNRKRSKKSTSSLSSFPKIPTIPLYPLQQEIIDNQKRLNVCVLGRRSGKSYLSSFLLLDTTYGQHNRLYVAPTFRDLNIVFDTLTDLLPKHKSITVNKSLKVIKLRTDTHHYDIQFHSSEAINRIRGNKYSLAIFDECGEIDNLEYAYTNVVRPALIDYAGTVFCFGTPKGLTYFYELYINPDAYTINLSSYVNPFIPKEEIDDLKNTLPERAFRQEILAEFIGDGRLFSNVDELSVGKEITTKEQNSTYVLGIDIAFQHDYTAIVVFDVTKKRVVRLFKGQWALEILCRLINDISLLYSAYQVYIDATGMGIPIVDNLQKYNLPLVPITITKDIKTYLIQNLMLKLEKKEVTLLDHKDMKQELTLYQEKNGKYNAPNGYHDDIVIALALAVWSIRG